MSKYWIIATDGKGLAQTIAIFEHEAAAVVAAKALSQRIDFSFNDSFTAFENDGPVQALLCAVSEKDEVVWDESHEKGAAA